MANPFDQFDNAPTQATGGNAFDQFDQASTPSFGQNMVNNFNSGIDSAKNFATLSDSGNHNAVENLRAKHAQGKATFSDYVDAFMEGGSNSPVGQGFNAVGGTVLNPVTTTVGNYVNPAIAKATGATPDEVAAAEMFLPIGLKGVKAVTPAAVSDAVGSAAKGAVALPGKVGDLIQAKAKPGGFIADEASGGDPPPPPAASVEDVGKLKTAAYQKADASGQVFSPNDLANKFATDVNQAMPKALSNGQLSEGDSYLHKILQTYAGFEDKPLGISEVDKIDKNLSGDIQRAYRAGYNHEAGILGDIQDNFRSQTVQAPAGADLAQARGLAAAEFKMRDLQTIKDTATSQSEIKTGLKTLYKKLQKNPMGWTEDEIAAVRDGSRTGLLTGALQTVGSKIISGFAGGVGGAIGGGGIPGALLGAAVGETVGYPLRQGAKAIQAAKLNNAINTVAQRPVVLSALQDAFLKAKAGIKTP